MALITRYYLSDVLGAGTMADPYRSVCSAIVNSLGEQGSGVVNAIRPPTWMTAFSKVLLSNHPLVYGDSRVLACPVADLDVSWGALGLAARGTFLTAIAARGFQVSGISLDQSYWQVLALLAQQIEPLFNINVFNVG